MDKKRIYIYENVYKMNDHTNLINLINSFKCKYTQNSNGMFINLNRDAQQVATGDAAGNRRRCTIVPDFSNSTFGGPLKSFTILDTDISGTSEVTYSVKMLDQSGNGGEYYLNTGRDNTDFNYILRSVSTLTVMEVAT